MSASGSENDLNYFELPMDVDNSLNEIDARPSGDEAVSNKYMKYFALETKNQDTEDILLA